jgi:glycosyltransferase involved in cell wall biosynthesis
VSVVVNGRFLRATPTGLHRVARSLLAAALDAGLDAEVVAPPGADDPLVTTTVGRAGEGTLSDHVWEQVVLPAHAKRRVVLSLANTAPLAARRGVVLVHDLAPLVEPGWFRPSMQVYGRAVLAAARRAEAVLTVSEQVAGELVAAGVTAPIDVVRNAVDPSFAPPPPEAVAATRARQDLADVPFVLMVGWADPRKDATTAALAHRIATARRPHRLVLVGLPHRNFAEVRLPDAATIQVVDYVDDGDLRALLAGAAALVYPSRYEGFGMPPLEAWACGTPAIVADTPALRESTEGRATYVRPGDVTGLADALVLALDGALPTPAPPAWTWADAAARLLEVMARVA